MIREDETVEIVPVTLGIISALGMDVCDVYSYDDILRVLVASVKSNEVSCH